MKKPSRPVSPSSSPARVVVPQRTAPSASRTIAAQREKKPAEAVQKRSFFSRLFGSRDKETSSSPKATDAIRVGSLERRPEQGKIAGAKDKKQIERIRVEDRGKPQIKLSDSDRDKKAKGQAAISSRLEAGSGSESKARTVSAGDSRLPNTKDKIEGKGDTFTAVRAGRGEISPKGNDARKIELDRDKKGVSSPQMRTAKGVNSAGAFHGRTGSVELTQRKADLSRGARVRAANPAGISTGEGRGTLPVSIGSAGASTLSDTGGVTINGNNNVYIAGDATGQYPHPYGSKRSHTNLSHLGSHRDWNDHGSYFSLKWSHSSSGRVVSFHHGSRYGVSYYHPRYHKKYLFVSIGGYWPFSYRYRRYYNYGCHPHRWYGADVITYPASDTYNTYNYYYDTPEPAAYYPPAYDTATGYDDFSDVRDRLARERLEELYRLEQEVQDAPYIETEADIRFNAGVEAFAEGDYLKAIDEFREAIILSPDDIVLPFTYTQALFAAGEYAHAASVLRAAIERMPEGEETVYYPRGLYVDEEPLTDQIAILAETATNEPFAGDFDLLLGYQLLGSDRLDEAGAALDSALADPANEKAAGLLLKLLEEARAEDSEVL